MTVSGRSAHLSKFPNNVMLWQIQSQKYLFTYLLTEGHSTFQQIWSHPAILYIPSFKAHCWRKNMRLLCIPLKGETSIVHPNLMLLLAFLKNKSNMPHYSEHVRLNSKCHERNEALVCLKNNYNSMKNRFGAGKTVWLSENRQRSWNHFRWGQIWIFESTFTKKKKKVVRSFSRGLFFSGCQNTLWALSKIHQTLPTLRADANLWRHVWSCLLILH